MNIVKKLIISLSFCMMLMVGGNVLAYTDTTITHNKKACPSISQATSYHTFYGGIKYESSHSAWGYFYTSTSNSIKEHYIQAIVKVGSTTYKGSKDYYESYKKTSKTYLVSTSHSHTRRVYN